MTRNYKIIFGRFSTLNGAQHKAELWEKIRADLNATGPKKSLDQWKRCWRDLKKGAKLKLMQIRHYRSRSGSGPPCPYVLTDQEQIIISICNLEALDGVEGQELGLNQTPPHSSFSPVRNSQGISSSN